LDKRIKKIILKSKKQIYSDMLGNNPSQFQGEGFEFKELREYVYGDDVRKIDWKSSAKLSKLYVKIYQEERELNVVVASMLNGSMGFGTALSKAEINAELVGLLGFLAIKNSDNFTNTIFADKLYTFDKATKKFFGVHKAIEDIINFKTLGKDANFKFMIDTLYKRVHKKSLIIIISDFIGDIDLRVLAKKHDVVALIVRDKFEENPKELGLLNMIDMDNNNKSFEGIIDTRAIDRYQKALQDNDEKLYIDFKKYGIRFSKVYTDDKVIMKLAKVFGR
jgi:uncharacterized protein (DUF58 family)